MAAAGVGQQWVLVEMVQAFYEVRPGQAPRAWRGDVRAASGSGSGEVSLELPRGRRPRAVLGGESGAELGSVLRGSGCAR